ncbi:MAG: hypothetical protein CPDRYMAC_6383 [uncultured Paraburkholderia sp.]|nr:MAG: hypothetical protein CPDRYDRY_6279 [uncultured Paraburkholderia sp.]CAH2944210.1 MAG: hypothetical protein CPDRYMAC_6383 [uncultured Paraburkholderia sp.]
MRRITLELLRHGPPHNQLLSPLTEYIALCENHGTLTFHVPFEHNQMLYRLRAFSYRLGPEPREFQVIDTANVIGKLLGEIPGLTADLNRQGTGAGIEDTCAAEQVTHLRLVVTASELALLPFELATSPTAFRARDSRSCCKRACRSVLRAKRGAFRRNSFAGMRSRAFFSPSRHRPVSKKCRRKRICSRCAKHSHRGSY